MNSRLFALCFLFLLSCSDSNTTTAGGSGSETTNTISGTIRDESGNTFSARVIVWSISEETGPQALDTIITAEDGAYSFVLDTESNVKVQINPLVHGEVDLNLVGIQALENTDSPDQDIEIGVDTACVVATSYSGETFGKDILFSILNSPWETSEIQVQGDDSILVLRGVAAGSHRATIILGERLTSGAFDRDYSISIESFNLEAGDSLWLSSSSWQIAHLSASEAEPLVLADFDDGSNRDNLGHIFWAYRETDNSGVLSEVNTDPMSEDNVDYLRTSIVFRNDTAAYGGVGMHLNRNKGTKAGFADANVSGLEIRARGKNVAIRPLLTGSPDLGVEQKSIPLQTLSEDWQVYRWEFTDFDLIHENETVSWSSLERHYFQYLQFSAGSTTESMSLEARTSQFDLDWVRFY